jgi:hypothetical protein
MANFSFSAIKKPTFRNPCTRRDCKDSTCKFVHEYQRVQFGDDLDDLEDYVHKKKRKLQA